MKVSVDNALMWRYFNGQCSLQEQERILEAIKGDSNLAKEFEQIREIWFTIRNQGNVIPFDSEVGWVRLEKKLTSESSPTILSAQPKSRGYWVARIAAVLVLLAGVGISIKFYLRNSENEGGNQIIAANGNRIIHLSDSTVVFLRKGGALDIPKNYSLQDRRVSLEGEGYFEVVHDRSHPFQVSCSNSRTVELGTTFLIRTHAREDQVVVFQGVVKLYSASDSNQSLLLLPGKAGKVHNGHVTEDSLLLRNALAWKEGILRFENTTLREMVQDLNNYFQSTITLSSALDRKADSIHVHFYFNNPDFHTVLEEIRLSGYSYDQSGDSVILK